MAQLFTLPIIEGTGNDVRDGVLQLLKDKDLYRPSPELLYRGFDRNRYDRDGVEDLLTYGTNCNLRGEPMPNICMNIEDWMFPERKGVYWMGDPMLFAKHGVAVFDSGQMFLRYKSPCVWEFKDQARRPGALVAIILWPTGNKYKW